jgi:mutator protein MutT
MAQGDRKLVVAALVTDARGFVLLTQRMPDQPMGGLWELPGGKVERGEAPSLALAREIEEELGCGARVGAVFEVVHHAYPTFELVMIVYRVHLLGPAQPLQVADLRWVAPAELTQYSVLQADVELLARIAERGYVDSPATSFDDLTRDERTGVLNPHYLRLRIAEELDRATRYGRPLSVLLIDVDDFERINDRHGRHLGNEILGRLGARIRQGARTMDRVGVNGGGTFCMVLPETNAGAALGLAERLRADIAALRFSVAEGESTDEVRCTVCCGVASTRGGHSVESKSLLARADAALWQAKAAGRNRTVVDSSADSTN